jgi:hypothetical protein
MILQNPEFLPDLSNFWFSKFNFIPISLKIAKMILINLVLILTIIKTTKACFGGCGLGLGGCGMMPGLGGLGGFGGFGGLGGLG